jgi:hypothetical protein
MKWSLTRATWIALAASSVLVGCGKQGEGERCDPRNGSADCESNLECKQGDGLTGADDQVGAGLCCRRTKAQSVLACFSNANVLDGVDGSSPGEQPPEAGPPEAGPLEAQPPEGGPLEAQPPEASTLETGSADVAVPREPDATTPRPDAAGDPADGAAD